MKLDELLNKQKYYIGYSILNIFEFCVNIVDYIFIFYSNIYDYFIGYTKRINTKD